MQSPAAPPEWSSLHLLGLSLGSAGLMLCANLLKKLHPRTASVGLPCMPFFHVEKGGQVALKTRVWQQYVMPFLFLKVVVRSKGLSHTLGLYSVECKSHCLSYSNISGALYVWPSALQVVGLRGDILYQNFRIHKPFHSHVILIAVWL